MAGASDTSELSRAAPASTAGLIISIIFASKLWMIDATSMSLYWVARLPIPRLTGQSSTSSLRTSAHEHKRRTSPARKRHRKIALSLGVIGALAAPILSGTYRAPYTYSVFVPLTPQGRESATALIQSEECRRNERITEQLKGVERGPGYRELIMNHFVRDYDCSAARKNLELNGIREEYPDSLKNLAVNIGVSAMAFSCVFALVFLIPLLVNAFVVLIRRYWNWLSA
jgi:hypothetical protein